MVQDHSKGVEREGMYRDIKEQHKVKEGVVFPAKEHLELGRVYPVSAAFLAQKSTSLLIAHHQACSSRRENYVQLSPSSDHHECHTSLHAWASSASSSAFLLKYHADSRNLHQCSSNACSSQENALS